MNAVRQLLLRVRTKGRRRPTTVKTVAMGRKREFEAFDRGDDTYVVERGILAHLTDNPSVLIVEKSALHRRGGGRVFTITSGNHSVAALPLLDGRFWKLSNLPPERRSAVLAGDVICANVVDGRLELSQRELSTAKLIAADHWLTDVVGLSMSDVVMGERNDATLEHYRRLGQEWRVKPLAWTEREMRAALASAHKRISTRIGYYHSAKGVHFLSFSEFRRFSELAERAPEDYVAGLKELVGVYEGNETSFVRMSKYRGHHEIEFFGLRRGAALETLIPEIERFVRDIEGGRTGQLGVIQRAREIVDEYESLLTSAALADDKSKTFVETMYMHITGEIYSIVGENTTPAFDDRRTALPGATFVEGRLVMHPLADSRSEVLLANLRSMLSQGEYIEYANIYELRKDEVTPVGKGRTREVVYKTNARPIEASMIEKGLSSARSGYGEYLLARIGAMRAIGVSLSGYYKLLRRRAKSGRESEFYIRKRCQGEPLDAIPANFFRTSEGDENRETVLGIATLMGDAAAQNMAMKKYDPATDSPLFGVGKEIYELGYDILLGRTVPKRVSVCSIRGTLGWPTIERTEENVEAMERFYLDRYARALAGFRRQHTVSMKELAERFADGFEFRTHAMAWKLSLMRDRFEEFGVSLAPGYRFREKWRFAMWALEEQEKRLSEIRKVFCEKAKAVENENIRNNSQ